MRLVLLGEGAACQCLYPSSHTRTHTHAHAVQRITDVGQCVVYTGLKSNVSAASTTRDIQISYEKSSQHTHTHTHTYTRAHTPTLLFTEPCSKPAHVHVRVGANQGGKSMCTRIERSHTQSARRVSFTVVGCVVVPLLFFGASLLFLDAA